MLVTLGSEEKPGEIQALDAELQKKQQEITNLSVKKLDECKRNLETANQNLIENLLKLPKQAKVVELHPEVIH